MPLLPRGDTWVDVFGGSGVVTLNREPSKLDVFNDRWSGVTAFFRAIIEHHDELISLIDEVMPHSREMFLHCKNTWEDDSDTVRRAAKWYYMINASFAGKGQFFGRNTASKATGRPSIANKLPLFANIRDRFCHNSMQIENLDWRECLKDFDGPKAVFYLDPPYVDSNVYKYGMTKQDHREMCEQIFKTEGFVALSGYDNGIYEQFPWNEKIEIPLSGAMRIHAHTETNNKEELVNTTQGGARMEYLWIKEWGG
jgi:DNA adenine methylase